MVENHWVPPAGAPYTGVNVNLTAGTATGTTDSVALIKEKAIEYDSGKTATEKNESLHSNGIRPSWEGTFSEAVNPIILQCYSKPRYAAYTNLGQLLELLTESPDAELFHHKFDGTMDSLAGGNILKKQGNGGVATYVEPGASGQAGDKALHFDGVADNVNAGANTFLSVVSRGSFAIHMQVRLNAINRTHMLVAQRNPTLSTNKGFRLYVNATNNLVAEFCDGTAAVITATGTTALAANTWYTIIVDVNRSDMMRISLNGAIEAFANISTQYGAIDDGSNLFTIGKASHAASDYAQMDLDNLRMFATGWHKWNVYDQADTIVIRRVDATTGIPSAVPANLKVFTDDGRFVYRDDSTFTSVELSGLAPGHYGAESGADRTTFTVLPSGYHLLTPQNRWLGGGGSEMPQFLTNWSQSRRMGLRTGKGPTSANWNSIETADDSYDWSSGTYNKDTITPNWSGVFGELHWEFNVDNPPGWTNGIPPLDEPTTVAKAGDFINVVLNRYPGMITHIAVTNEPGRGTRFVSGATAHDKDISLTNVLRDYFAEARAEVDAYNLAHPSQPPVLLTGPNFQDLQGDPNNPNNTEQFGWEDLKLLSQNGGMAYLDVFSVHDYWNGFSAPDHDNPSAPWYAYPHTRKSMRTHIDWVKTWIGSKPWQFEEWGVFGRSWIGTANFGTINTQYTEIDWYVGMSRAIKFAVMALGYGGIQSIMPWKMVHSLTTYPSVKSTEYDAFEVRQSAVAVRGLHPRTAALLALAWRLKNPFGENAQWTRFVEVTLSSSSHVQIDEWQGLFGKFCFVWTREYVNSSNQPIQETATLNFPHAVTRRTIWDWSVSRRQYTVTHMPHLYYTDLDTVQAALSP